MSLRPFLEGQNSGSRDESCSTPGYLTTSFHIMDPNIRISSQVRAPRRTFRKIFSILDSDVSALLSFLLHGHSFAHAARRTLHFSPHPNRSYLPTPLQSSSIPQLTDISEQFRHLRSLSSPKMPIASNRCMQCDHIRIRRQIEISTGRRPRCHQISGVLYESLLNWSRCVPSHFPNYLLTQISVLPQSITIPIYSSSSFVAPTSPRNGRRRGKS